MKAGYLGPLGTFSHQAALEVFKEDEIKPYDTIYQVLMAVEKGELDCGIVPIENSTEGTVNATVDALVFDLNLYIQKLLTCMDEAKQVILRIGKDYFMDCYIKGFEPIIDTSIYDLKMNILLLYNYNNIQNL